MIVIGDGFQDLGVGGGGFFFFVVWGGGGDP